MSSVHPRILVVEDHHDSLIALTSLLIRRGYDTLIAVDVKSALAVGAANDFDLLVCDTSLPDGSCAEVVTGLRKSRQFHSIALTSSSGQTGELDRSKNAGLAADFDLSIAKPFNPRALQSAVDTMLAAPDA